MDAPPSTHDVTPPSDAAITPADLRRASRARRKVLRSEIRRFTKRSRRRRLGWGIAGGAIALVAAAAFVPPYTPLFAVERVTVTGTTALDPHVISSAVSDQVGTPLGLLDRSEIKAALMKFPMIETYAVEARPPHDLNIRITERTAVGVVESDAGYTVLDAAGVVLSTSQVRPDGQPLLEVSGGPGSPAFLTVGLVIRSLPAELRSQLIGAAAGSADDVTLTLDSGAEVVWGNEQRSAEKAYILQLAVTKFPEARFFDVSTPEALIAK